jgi:hypothetical protein
MHMYYNNDYSRKETMNSKTVRSNYDKLKINYCELLLSTIVNYVWKI